MDASNVKAFQTAGGPRSRVKIEQRGAALRRGDRGGIGVVDLKPRLYPAVLVGVDEPGKPHYQRLPGVVEIPEYGKQATLVV